MAEQQNLGPVDRLLLLVADGQSLSRRVLGNERQSARLGERLSCLKHPLWQLQARVQTQAETPPDFIHTLAEEVSHCLEVLLELTHPDWWNQIRRKVRITETKRWLCWRVRGSSVRHWFQRGFIVVVGRRVRIRT